jgi:hypothetical protein
MTYEDQMKSPKWQKKRLEILALSNFRCDECGDKKTQLHVHHIHYRRGHKIWEYSNDELRCLCSDCHTQNHKVQRDIIESLGLLELMTSQKCKEMVLGYIHGLIGPPDSNMTSSDYRNGYLAAENTL